LPFTLYPLFFSSNSAFITISRLNAFSAPGLNSALPRGLTILIPATTRGEPTMTATGVIVHICTTGTPDRSISLLSAAPQRVLVPQVEVSITPETPPAFRSAPIALPILLEFSTVVDTPAVV
jgi:hypothetical protein